jgi:hypothetical protein
MMPKLKVAAFAICMGLRHGKFHKNSGHAHSGLRKKLEKDTASPEFIVTAPNAGYKFVGAKKTEG